MEQNIKELGAALERRRKLGYELEGLLKQSERLEERARLLRQDKFNEQNDVEELEGRSLRRLFLTLTGKLDEELTKERREAAEAEVRYDAVAAELETINKKISSHRIELGRLSGIERQYDEALKARRSELKALNGELADEIARCEEEINTAENKLREYDEAISAGERALGIAEQLIRHLVSAGDYAAWDVFGGGLIADMAKHSELDEAQELVERLQSHLRDFNTELADVELESDARLDIDDALRFADYFFDGFIVDIMVSDRIKKSLESVRTTRSEVAGVLHRLEDDREGIKKQCSICKNKLESLTLNS